MSKKKLIHRSWNAPCIFPLCMFAFVPSVWSNSHTHQLSTNCKSSALPVSLHGNIFSLGCSQATTASHLTCRTSYTHPWACQPSTLYWAPQGQGLSLWILIASGWCVSTQQYFVSLNRKKMLFTSPSWRLHDTALVLKLSPARIGKSSYPVLLIVS